MKEIQVKQQTIRNQVTAEPQGNQTSAQWSGGKPSILVFDVNETLIDFEVMSIHKVSVKPADLEALKKGMMTMPAHPDVEEGLKQLKDAGFRMVTLTNSPPNPHGKSPLENAGLADFFERQFSIEAARAYKPAQVLYHMVAQELDVPPSACCMIATHVWDTIGAQSAGLAAGLLTRPGNAPLPIPGLPQPNVIAPDLPALSTQMIKLWRS